MDKKILIIFKTGDVFITNRAAFDTTAWGVNAIGNFRGDSEKKELQIPWTSIAHVEKVIS